MESHFSFGKVYKNSGSNLPSFAGTLYLIGMKRYLLLWMVLLIGLSSCIKDYSQEGGPGPDPLPPITDTTFFVNMEVDSEKVVYISGQNGYALYFASGAPVPNIPQTYACGLVGNNPASSFEFKKAFLTYSIADSTRPIITQKALAFFAPGNYLYKDTDYLEGVRLTWTDPQGTAWNTGLVFSSDADNNFTITKTSTVTNAGQVIGIVMEAKFTCKLYISNGQSKQVRNGTFRLGFWL